MAQKVSGIVKKILSVMLIMLLIPNAYCLEFADSSQDASTSTDQSSGEIVSSLDGESEDLNTEIEIEESSSEKKNSDKNNKKEDDSEQLLTATATSTDNTDGAVEPLDTYKSYLTPTFENQNDYFDNSLFTGSFGYTYPIEAVKGRAGFEPVVSLTYSSSTGMDGTYGSLGMGWSLNDNCIVRDTRYTPDNTNDDRFILYLDGSSYKLIYVESNDSYHTEIESFMKIEKESTTTNSYGEYWIVKLPDGTQYRFGYNNDSEAVNSVSIRNYVSKWWLDKIEDVNGNQILYNYLENPKSGEIGSTYLKNITYNDDSSSVEFEFIDKPNTFTLYEYGNKISEKSLISNISVKNNGTSVWVYEIQYQNENSKMFLANITKSSADESFPATEFDYGGGGSGWTLDDSWKLPTIFTGGTWDYGVRLADVNGD
ncbi:SpvB/TcaC N-terminal domain-containing protein, partial [Methanococcus maripaludis]